MLLLLLSRMLDKLLLSVTTCRAQCSVLLLSALSLNSSKIPGAHVKPHNWFILGTVLLAGSVTTGNRQRPVCPTPFGWAGEGAWLALLPAAQHPQSAGQCPTDCCSPPQCLECSVQTHCLNLHSVAPVYVCASRPCPCLRSVLVLLQPSAPQVSACCKQPSCNLADTQTCWAPGS